jgi:putative MATE family efflux protein
MMRDKQKTGLNSRAAGSLSASYNPITEGVIWKQILFFFFPMLLSSFFQQLYNTADALIVGRIAGKEALSAVGGSAGSVLGIFMMFYVGFAGGAAVLAAQYFGAKKEAATQAAVRTSLKISALLGLCGTLICLVFAGSILGLMHTPADVMAPSLSYLRIVALGMIPNALYNMGASSLRAIGDARRPLYVLIFTCLCNIGLDLVFVAGLRMGAAGAALATILCQLLSAVLVLVCLRQVILSAKDPEAAPDNSILISARDIPVRILKMGLPLGFTEVMYTFANVVLMAAINSFGTDTVAAYAAYGKIDAIFWMIVGSFGISITTFVGQNMGAGKWGRVRQSIRDCALMMFTALGVVIAALFLFARPLQGLFCTDPDVIDIGVQMMRFLMPFYVLYIPIEVLFGALRGMGNALAPTLLTFFGVCVLRSAWGIWIVPLHHTVNMVLTGFPVTWIVTSIAFGIYYHWYIRRLLPKQA